MHRFKKIGVVLNLERSNTDALAHANELVKTNQATVHLLCIAPGNLAVDQYEEITNTLKNTVDFDFSVSYLTGKPVVEITRYSAENQLDMLLIEPDSDDDALNKFFHGSLSLSLMRKAPCPVWVVKKPVSKTYQRILIAVDPKCLDEEKVESNLNGKLIEIGTSYAKRQSAECHLVTAWALDGEESLRGPFINMPEEEIEKLKTEQHMVCAKAFEQLQQSHLDDLVGCETHMLYGDPGEAIAKFVAEKAIDLIVMGTLARAGVQGFLIGNTAECIINQVDCSIMAIKPDGFVSPILS